jgi:hypothetical protein
LNTLAAPSPLHLTDVEQINAADQIIGEGTTPDGNTRDFLLTPTRRWPPRQPGPLDHLEASGPGPSRSQPIRKYEPSGDPPGELQRRPIEGSSNGTTRDGARCRPRRVPLRPAPWRA